MSYADLSALKSHLRLSENDSLDDVELQRALDGATWMIDQVASRSFAPVEIGPAEDRGYHYDAPHYDRRYGWVVEIPDLTSGIGGAEIFTWNAADAAWTTPVDMSKVVWLPRNGAPEPDPWTQAVLPPGSGSFERASYSYTDPNTVTVMVRADFGWLAVPAAVEEACLIQAARLFRRRDALFGVVNSIDGSSQMRLKQAMDSDALVLLDGLIKRWGAR